ncbi:V-set and immunoglobulin domain-containing protein 1-like, partial [Scleropages formosus]
IYYYQAGQSTIPQNYHGRVIVPPSPNTTRNASITITDVSPADSGTYYCEVHNMPDSLGQTEGRVILNVLEKPSKPFCAIHGTVESGHLVTLTCHTEQGSPTPTYSWTKTGVLQIGNLSQFEFGTYQCNASNVVGYDICTVNLNEELSDGVIAGAVIGALLASALIIFIVWYILHSLRKKQYKAVKVAAGTEMQVKSQSGNTAKFDSMHGSEENSQATASAAPTEAAESQGGEEKEPVV